MTKEKFYVKTICPEISEILQKKAFEAGIKWNVIGEQEVKCANRPYLFIHEDGALCWGDRPDNGYTHHSIEAALKYFADLKAENEKPKWKEGDWVIALCSDTEYIGKYMGEKEDCGTWQLLKDWREFPVTEYKSNNGGYFNSIKRLATPEEIQAATGFPFEYTDYYNNKHEVLFDVTGDLQIRRKHSHGADVVGLPQEACFEIIKRAGWKK